MGIELKSVGEQLAEAKALLLSTIDEKTLEKRIAVRAFLFYEWCEKNGFKDDPLGNWYGAEFAEVFGLPLPEVS